MEYGAKIGRQVKALDSVLGLRASQWSLAMTCSCLPAHPRRGSSAKKVLEIKRVSEEELAPLRRPTNHWVRWVNKGGFTLS